MRDCDEDPSVYNAHYEVEVIIDRPVAQVWRQFVDIGSWVTSHNIENVHGIPGTVGSVTRVSFKGAKDLGLPLPHHHFCKIIKLVPERQYVLKTYSEKGGSYGWLGTAFDDTRFVEVDGKTKVVFNLYDEIRAEAVVKDPASMDVAMESSREGMLKNLNVLKCLVEGQ